MPLHYMAGQEGFSGFFRFLICEGVLPGEYEVSLIENIACPWIFKIKGLS